LGTDEQHGCCKKLNLHGENVFLEMVAANIWKFIEMSNKSTS
jgi:hypothetical protein